MHARRRRFLPARSAAAALVTALVASLAAAAPAAADAAPANDDFADAEDLGSAASLDIVRSTVGATAEANEAGIATVWFAWTAPDDGRLTIDTCGVETTFNTRLGVGIDADGVLPLDQVIAQGDDECGSSSELTFEPTEGQTYFVYVDGFGGATGDVRLRFDFLAGPANDDLDEAVHAGTGDGVVVTGTNVAATWEEDEPTFAARSVWWTWTADQPGRITIDTCDSDFDTRLSVYTDADGQYPIDQHVASDEDGCGNRSQVVFESHSVPRTYLIRVSGFGDEGTISLKFAVQRAPLNDNFADSWLLAPTGDADLRTGTNDAASEEDGEGRLRSVWWHWTAQASGPATVDTCGSDFNTQLQVYTGSTLDALTSTGFDEDAGGECGTRSRVSFAAVLGTTYRIQVAGAGGNQGNITLELQGPPDVTPPTAEITSGPTGTITTSSATFGMRASENASTFQCRIDDGEFTPCNDGNASTRTDYEARTDGSVTFDGLTSGQHTAAVRAVDGSGNVGPAVTQVFTVDLPQPPAPTDLAISDVTLAEGDAGTTAFTFTITRTGGPDEVASVAYATTAGTATAESDFAGGEGRVDLPVGESTTVTVLVHGDTEVEADEVFHVDLSAPSGNARIVDSRGTGTIVNDDTAPVDSTKPTTTITSGPADGSRIAVNRAQFGFTADEPATFFCKVDAGAYASCTSPKVLTGLSDGTHTLSVYAVDTAANAGDPVTRTFTVTAAACASAKAAQTKAAAALAKAKKKLKAATTATAKAKAKAKVKKAKKALAEAKAGVTANC